MGKSRPTIILSAAMSLDGKIATITGDSEFSTKQDKIRVHKLRTRVDAILVGINTVKRDDPLLTVRHVKGRNPIRVILDSRASISSKSRIVKTCKKIPTIIAISKKASKKNLTRLQSHPLEIIVLGKNHVNIKKLLNSLFRKKIKKILLEGGGNINWEFIRQGLVDEVIIAITPYIVGGKNAISLVDGKGFSTIAISPRIKLKKITQNRNELVLQYSFSK